MKSAIAKKYKLNIAGVAHCRSLEKLAQYTSALARRNLCFADNTAAFFKAEMVSKRIDKNKNYHFVFITNDSFK